MAILSLVFATFFCRTGYLVYAFGDEYTIAPVVSTTKWLKLQEISI